VIDPLLVLVVEDDPDIREAVVDLLASSGYQVASASNGQEALALLQREHVRPAVILLDLLMPTMNGWQFRRAMRGDPSIATIPVVVLTGGSYLDEAIESIGADAWLSKPVNADDLIAVVARVAGGGAEAT
jgi:CheY-like chemotaxis protein